MAIYLKHITYWLSLVLFFACQSTPNDNYPRRVEILFLGHNSEHHNSAAYLPYLAAALTPKGINFTYTNNPEDLNKENLVHYDGVALYANHDSITVAQERALLNFVKSGKGFIPIHSASYCFRNSDAFVQLVGAQFKSHKTDTFTADIVNTEHPITKGFEAFETWDETYIHHLHNEDRTVLMERVEGDHREPWTWIRNYGKGKVFYTAYGHDERTWINPDFHRLLERGILWAVGEQVSTNLAKLSFPTLAYIDAKIPNYEKRNPPPQLQTPLSIEASQSLIQVPAGFELSLFASEPDINTPVSMAFDEKGRLWYLETTDYPNEINIADGAGNDKIKIVEDTDGDGKADKFTVFADKLSVPTSLVFYNGGMIVAQAPDFLFLKDTDGDGKADIQEKIISGWGTFDTHAGPSNLHYGFDNWIWGTVGYSAFEGKVGEDSLKFGQGIFRFKPDGSALEYMGSTSNNTWGLGFSETFDVFASTANNTHSAYLGIPHRYYEGLDEISGRDVKKIDGHYLFHPITQNFRQVDVFGGYTAAAGHNLYTARSYPKEYWNRIALVCEPTGHLLHKAILEKDGAGFKEKDGWNLLASADEWVSPVHAEVGPDGAVWILDWYNFIIQHNPTPTGFENGPGNAHINPLRDKQRGRIYQLRYKGGKDSKSYQLDKEDADGLIAALKSDNMLWRMHAQRLLVERNETDVLGALFSIIENKDVDEIGLNSPVIHALWTLHGLGVLDGSHQKAKTVAEGALSHPAAGVRKAAIQVLGKDRDLRNLLVEKKLLFDKDAHTRLTAILALTDTPFGDSLGEQLYTLSQDATIQQDEWLNKALYIGMVKHRNSFIKALHKNEPALVNNLTVEPEIQINWLDTNLDVSDWANIKVPSRWSEAGFKELSGMDGEMWYHTTFDLTTAQATAKQALHFGIIDETDYVYINGKKVGQTLSSWGDDRVYSIKSGILKTGKNTMTINVHDYGGRGGILGVGGKEVFLLSGTNKIDIAGNWKAKVDKVYRKDTPVFVDGVTPISLFLKKYGPYASQVANKIEAENNQPADQTITIKTIRDQMKYDKELFTVEAGTTIEIIFENNDAMQHNLLIVEPGALAIVGNVAETMAKTPSGVANGYVPELDQVLAYTVLVDPGTTSKLRLDVPDQTGDYPFVCTFPGHWQTMNGVMRVVASGAL